MHMRVRTHTHPAMTELGWDGRGRQVEKPPASSCIAISVLTNCLGHRSHGNQSSLKVRRGMDSTDHSESETYMTGWTLIVLKKQAKFQRNAIKQFI